MLKIFRLILYCFKAIKTKQLLKKLNKKYPYYKKVHVFSHLGDTCFALSLLKSLPKTNILVVAPNNLKKIVKLYDDYYNDAIFINDKLSSQCKEVAESPFCSIFNKAKNNIVPWPWYYYKNGMELQIKCSAMYAIQRDYDVYDIESHLTFPNVPNVSDERVMNILQCEIEDFKRIIIISPYANSSPALDECDWIKLVEMLNNKGLTIYSNVTSQQNEIAGTKRLECTLIDFYNICKRVKCLLGVRSGIFDFVISSGINVVSLVTNYYYYAYSLESWKQSCRILEIWCKDDKAIDILNISNFIDEVYCEN